MSNPTPIAVCISDLHLSLLQPVCRADEDWMEVQADYLQQVKVFAGNLPILCAGDIFDRWNAPPELINFALEHLPDGMICIPGQHDLPNHRMDLMHRSGYGVLVKAGKIVDISGKNSGFASFTVWGYGWEQSAELKDDDERDENINIALIHRYVFADESTSFPGAPKEAHISGLKKELDVYDVAVFGDNHKGFTGGVKTKSGVCDIINCGGFIRRKSDEINYQPTVGIIYSDGTVGRQRLDTGGDRFHEDHKDRKEVPFNMKEFIQGLEELGEHGLNFREAVEHHLKSEDIDEGTREIILSALDAK